MIITIMITMIIMIITIMITMNYHAPSASLKTLFSLFTFNLIMSTTIPISSSAVKGPTPMSRYQSKTLGPKLPPRAPGTLESTGEGVSNSRSAPPQRPTTPPVCTGDDKNNRERRFRNSGTPSSDNGQIQLLIVSFGQEILMPSAYPPRVCACVAERECAK